MTRMWIPRTILQSLIRYRGILCASALVAAGTLSAAPAAALGAQVKLPPPSKSSPVKPLAPKGDRRDPDVPPAYRPPPGMCRVWLQNVPPAQQPAATDCATAVRNRPANGRVLFGDDYVEKPTTSSRGGAGDGAPARAVLQLAGTPHGQPRFHGPNAGDAERIAEGSVDHAFDGDTVAAPVRRPVAAPRTDRRGVEDPRLDPRDVDDGDDADDRWNAGYAAGYRDAMRGRRSRVRGVDRAADGGPDLGIGLDRGNPAGTALIVPNDGGDPRYYNNGRYPPPGRANGVCLDRDGDGWCDDPRYGAPVCRDLDGDGRCDDYPAYAASPYPTALPDMRAAVAFQRGDAAASATVLRWLGTSEVTARATDLRRTGSPSRVTWLDANTQALLQVWSDRDGDGTADRVEVYRDGRRVKLIGR